MKRQWLVASAILAAGIAAGWTGAQTQVQPKNSDTAPTAQTRQEAVARTTPLDTLDWLVGDWVADGDEVKAEFSCDYTKNDSFLLRPFRIVRKNGETFSGTQLIAWDPAQEAIRSWTFDSNAGFGEEIWRQSGKRYSIRARYTLPDGGSASAIHVLTYIDDNTCTWKSVNREIDGQFQPDTDEIKIVRRPNGGDAKGGN
jgi:hypothetical protein